MIIEVKQISAGTVRAYEIWRDGVLCRQGRAPFLRKNGEIQLQEKDGEHTIYMSRAGVLPFKDWMNPFTFKAEKLKGMTEWLDAEGQVQAVYSRVSYEFIMSAHYIQQNEGDRITLYLLARGSQELLLVYSGREQIAQIERKTRITDQRDHYTVWLLDQYGQHADLLSMFVLCYDHTTHGDRGEVKIGYTQKNWTWSYTQANELYDPQWMKRWFPEAEITQVPLDEAYNRRIKKQLKGTSIALLLVFMAAVVFMITVAVSNGGSRLAGGLIVLIILWGYNRITYIRKTRR